MTELKDLLFDVERIENPSKAVSAQSYQIVGFIDGENEEPTILNTCSERFNLKKNEDVFPVIENMLVDANCLFDKGYKMNEEKTTFHAQYIIKKKDGVDVGIDVGGYGDKIYPTAIVDNSYNGFAQGSLTFGYFRMICSNGLVIPLEGKEESNFIIKGKHTKKLDFSFDQLLAKINFFLAEQNKMQKKFEVLTDRIVPTFEERVVEVVTATGVNVSQEQFKAINETIAKEAKALGTNVNDFLIYNGINGHIYKGENLKGERTKALPEVKRKEDKKVFSYMLAN